MRGPEFQQPRRSFTIPCPFRKKTDKICALRDGRKAIFGGACFSCLVPERGLPVGYYLVGSTPSKYCSSEALTPNESPRVCVNAGDRFKERTGYSFLDYMAVFLYRRNLSDTPNSPRSPFLSSNHTQRAQHIVREAQQKGTRGIIILGWNAARAFRWSTLTLPRYLEWGRVQQGICHTPAAVVPEINRSTWWKDQDNQDTALRFFESIRPKEV